MASCALPLDVGLHIGRRHQAHRMPQRLQLFEQPLRRSPIAARKLRLAFENLRQHRDPRLELGQRLRVALIAELRRTGAQHLAHCVARDAKLPRNPLDPFAVLEMLKPDPRNRLRLGVLSPTLVPSSNSDPPRMAGLSFEDR